MSLPELHSKAIRLRALSLDDVEGNYPSWLNDPLVTQFNSHGQTHYTKEMARDYISNVQDSSTHQVFAIIFKNKHIGNISLQNIDQRNNSAEFAILIGDTSIYGKGIGYQAAQLLIRYGFNTLKLHRIYCGTALNNIGMQKLAHKLGMKEEGQRKDALYKNGTYLDVLEYGMIQE